MAHKRYDALRIVKHVSSTRKFWYVISVRMESTKLKCVNHVIRSIVISVSIRMAKNCAFYVRIYIAWTSLNSVYTQRNIKW